MFSQLLFKLHHGPGPGVRGSLGLGRSLLSRRKNNFNFPLSTAATTTTTTTPAPAPGSTASTLSASSTAQPSSVSPSSSSSSSPSPAATSTASTTPIIEPPSGPQEDPDFHSAVIWFENVFPFKIALFDPRTYYADSFITKNRHLKLVPERFPEGAEFKIKSVEANLKEGGLYMEFKYKGGTVDEALEAIKSNLRIQGIISYFNFSPINAFQVKGTPWIEDLVSRVPSRRLHVEFIKGPDLTVESLFREFRVFGRIVDITLQKSSDKEIPRYASVQFLRKRAATSARNCIHGEMFGDTKLAIGYEVNQGWYYKASHWFMGNLRISVPLILAFVAGLGFLVFDPWRVFSITNQITGRYSLGQYSRSASKWLQLFSSFFTELMDVFTSAKVDEIMSSKPDDLESGHQWTERELQAKSLGSYFKQAPDGLILVSGPKGSGKTGFVNETLASRKNKLIINCDDLVGKGDYQLLSQLAAQVNFFPTFSFASQVSSYVDTIITATTGAKANLATTNDGEVRKILECVTLALQKITEKQITKRNAALKKLESSTASDMPVIAVPDIDYPVVIIDGFLSKENIREQYLFSQLTTWAAQLNEYHVAHVLFVSDHPSAQQTIGKALPTKTLEVFHLSDASPETSLSYVRKRLGPSFRTEGQTEKYLAALGGRLHDLDLFVSKIQTGMTPEAAFDDMCHKALAELRKLGFVDVSSKVGWSTIQFYKVAQLLAKKSEIQFDELAVSPLFSNDSAPIMEMERAGLISISHRNSRPYSIRANRPIFGTAFKEMVSDKKLDAYMGVLTNKQLAQNATKKIVEYEQEMEILNRILCERGSQWISAVKSDPLENRRSFLSNQIGIYNGKAVSYEESMERAKKSLKLLE